MAQEIINVGTNPNDGTGDTLRGAFVKTDNNFDDLYTNKQDTLVSGTNIKTINGNSLLGSGNLTIGGITGSGTDNYIPRFNGTTALENSLIFDDGTNIGIGTVSPISKFNLVGGAASFDFGGFANIPAIKLLASGDEPTLRFYRPSGGTPNARIFQIQNTIGDLTFGYASANKYSESTFTEAMRITSIGDVGIGTSSPFAKLQVEGSFFAGDSTGTLPFINITSNAAQITTPGVSSFTSGLSLTDGFGELGLNPGGDVTGVIFNSDGVWFRNINGNTFGLIRTESYLFTNMIGAQGTPTNEIIIANWIGILDTQSNQMYYLPVYQ